MLGSKCGVITVAVGAVLVVVSCVVSFVVIPIFIENLIINEVVLIEDTIQMERFEQVPFTLNFSVWIWNITNPADVLQGAAPVLTEVGPYIYNTLLTITDALTVMGNIVRKRAHSVTRVPELIVPTLNRLNQSRKVSSKDEDHVTYTRIDQFQFDPEGSFPNAEDDRVTIVNVPYNAILQVAETMFPNLMGILGTALNGVFGQYNSPISEVTVRDFLFDGIPVCQNPGLIGGIACAQIRQLSADAKNLVEQEDGSLIFSLMSYKDGFPSGEYVVNRGVKDHTKLGRIEQYQGLPYLDYWVDDEDAAGGAGGPGVCNMVNGTDSGIFPPFVDDYTSVYALNTDICRSVELRYQYDTEYEGIPAKRFSLNEWFLDNNEGCFCLNVTRSGTCLLPGAMELYTCVGAFLVLTYPHFLYADPSYRNGVIGMDPIEENHRIFLDLEPKTGTIIRGYKRAQFNIFLRPVAGIAATQSLRDTLTPIAWFQEGMSLPQEFVNEVNSKLLAPLNLVQILVPIMISLFGLVLISGVVIIAIAKFRPSVVTLTTHAGSQHK